MSALASADLEALRAAAGADAVDENATLAVDGSHLVATVEPPDASALARTVAVLAARGIGCVVMGSGSRLARGNPPRGARIALSTRRLDRILEFDAEEGVVHAEAGAPLLQIAACVAPASTGWSLPLDARSQSTLGGVLATGAVGPRHLGWGRPRDLVLGLDVVLGDGTATRCGGRVVKNVTGYDLMKLHIGASGALGVITSAWLRLRPEAEAHRVLAAQLPAGPETMERALAAARFTTARACIAVDASLALAVEPRRAPQTGWLLLVECAGDEAAVSQDARRLATEFGAEETDGLALTRGGAIERGSFGEVGLRFRLAVLPSRVAAVVDELHRAGAALVVHAGTGLVHARIALDAEVDGIGLDRAWIAARRAARLGDGHVVLESAPAWAKARADVYGDASDEWRLARALKARFDPAAVLNPGRWVGRI